MITSRKIYILLSSAGLRVYSGKAHLDLAVQFPIGLLEHQEIKDRSIYNNLVQSVIARLPENEFTLLISDEFVYKKSLPADFNLVHFTEKQDFLTMLPFDEAKIAHKHVQTVNKSELIAVNRELYEPILKAAAKANKKISHIIPLSLIHTDSSSLPDHKMLSRNHSYDSFVKHDLNSADHGIPWTDPLSRITYTPEPETGNQPNKRLIALFTVFGLALSVLVFLIFKNARDNQALALNKTVTKLPVMAPTLTTTPTPTVVYKNLTDLKVQILNGSAKSGQATKLKETLTDLGISRIETGNYTSKEAEDILLSLSANLSASDSALLAEKINSAFPDLSISQSATDSAEYDILIVIGNQSVLE